MFVEKLKKSQVQSILNHVYGLAVNLVDGDIQWKFDLDNGLIVCIVSVFNEGKCSIALRDSSITLANGSKRYSQAIQKVIDNNEYKNQMYRIFGKDYALYLKELKNVQKEF